ncbi:hypothetical protein PMZ80_004359 [Knufia obscura]|uniref:Uncharacterized protein n=1 Tax=Knufia obscura TaxID=1635080 RepID=A0ABR0RRV7_9EURO|nr:hypothetical protein PMZ80_004359 [Knufia obscura]
MSRRQTTSSDDDDDAANVSGSHSNRKLGTKGDEGKETGALVNQKSETTTAGNDQPSILTSTEGSALTAEQLNDIYQRSSEAKKWSEYQGDVLLPDDLAGVEGTGSRPRRGAIAGDDSFLSDTSSASADTRTAAATSVPNITEATRPQTGTETAEAKRRAEDAWRREQDNRDFINWRLRPNGTTEREVAGRAVWQADEGAKRRAEAGQFDGHDEVAVVSSPLKGGENM